MIPFRAESILGNELTETSEFSSHIGNTKLINQLSEEQLRKMVGIIHNSYTLLYIIFCRFAIDSLAKKIREMMDNKHLNLGGCHLNLGILDFRNIPYTCRT